jgi:hypothetical protein
MANTGSLYRYFVDGDCYMQENNCFSGVLMLTNAVHQLRSRLPPTEQGEVYSAFPDSLLQMFLPH